jgi:hypothetical protein
LFFIRLAARGIAGRLAGASFAAMPRSGEPDTNPRNLRNLRLKKPSMRQRRKAPPQPPLHLGDVGLPACACGGLLKSVQPQISQIHRIVI